MGVARRVLAAIKGSTKGFFDDIQMYDSPRLVYQIAFQSPGILSNFFSLEIALNYENIFIEKTIVGVEARQARDCASSNYLWWIWMVIPSFLSRINATEWHQTGQKEKKKWISCTIGYERKAMQNSECNHLERSWKMNDAIKTQLTSWQSQHCCLVCNISRVYETNQW